MCRICNENICDQISHLRKHKVLFMQERNRTSVTTVTQFLKKDIAAVHKGKK